MKRVSIVISVVVALVVATVALAGYTYDGTINPEDFKTWNHEYLGVVELGQGTGSQLSMHVFRVYKDGMEADVGLVGTKDGRVIVFMYSYKIKGVEYIFMLQGNVHYKQIKPEKINV